MGKIKPLKGSDSPCCCCKNLIYKIELLRNDIGKLKREKRYLNNKLNDAISSQHNAMYKAIHLADRNKLLEDEMKAIDALALKVEEESNYTNATNINKIRLLEDQLNTTEIALQLSKCDCTKLKNKCDEITDQLDKIKGENIKLSSLLEAAINEKQMLVSKLNTAQIIEEALNDEIDKLQVRVGKQNRLISELKFEGMTSRFNGEELEDQSGSMEESVTLENSQIHSELKRASTDENQPEYRRKVNKAKSTRGKTRKTRTATKAVKDLGDQSETMEESSALENNRIRSKLKSASTKETNKPDYRREVNKSKSTVRSKSTESGKTTEKKKETNKLIDGVKHKNNHRNKGKDCIGTKLIDPADTIPRGFHLNHMRQVSSSTRKISTLRKNNNDAFMARVPSTSQDDGTNETVFSDTLLSI